VPKTLIIVESPAKAKTISKFLGSGYIVESSYGHIRDLPRNADEIPAKVKGQAWARLGINVNNDFEPLYIVSAEKRQQVAKLKILVKDADQVILATDEDREGEAIAWHLLDELKPKVPVKRMVFHEITKEAIQHAIDHPRAVNDNLVQAQETRRALDRLYGYEVSPVLWKKVKPSLSAGRVQSVATRLIVDRERDRMGFTPASWWDLEAVFQTQKNENFPAQLSELDGKRLAAGKDFDSSGKFLGEGKTVRLAEAEARGLAAALHGANFRVTGTEEKPFTQRPYAPFITSTLQQEGGRKLGFGAQRTMRAAQRLYEGGYITYMRTDSTNLSKEALNAARAQVLELYGEVFLHPTPRTYEKKVKNAQEAHEAIRPAGERFRTPQELRAELGDDEWKLYDLIWKRTVAGQMADAKGRRLSARIAAKGSDGREAAFTASGKVIDFPGFLRAYVEGSDDPEAALEDREVVLPALVQGDTVKDEKLEPKGHTTQAPARYTEASLVQGLEEKGIGRPSTYASIIQTVQDRGYVFKRGQALVPTFIGFSVVQLLEQNFGQLVDYSFTARMEDDLDRIADGQSKRISFLNDFYFGAERGLKPMIEQRLESIDPRVVATIHVPRLEDSGIEVRVGRYGAFMRRSTEEGTDQTGNIPDDLAPDELTLEKAEELFSKKSSEAVLGVDAGTGLNVYAKNGRFGPYVQLGESGEPNTKMASLFPNEKLEELSLERALKLLSLPRFVGMVEGEEVWAFNGKFGPYIKRGKDSRTLSGGHEQLFTLTLEQAEALLKEPKQARGRTTKEPVAVFNYPDRGAIQLLDGRFGLYLTDGTLNAYLKREDNAQTLDAAGIRNIFEERGKPPKSKAKGATRAGTKAPAKAGAKTAGKTAAKKPATSSAGSAKTSAAKTKGVKAAKPKGAPKKTANRRASTGKTDGAVEKAKPSWTELEPFTADFDPTTAQLLKLINGDRMPMASAAQQLRITQEDAMTRYRSSNFKLYNLFRRSKPSAA
jgi:DNA topoisomerase I